VIYDEGASRLISDHGARTLYLAVFNSTLDVLVVLGIAECDVEQLAVIHVFTANLSLLAAYLTRNIGRGPEFAPDADKPTGGSQG